MPNLSKGEVSSAKELSRFLEEFTRGLPLSEHNLPIGADGDELTGVILFQWLSVLLVKAGVFLAPQLPTFFQVVTGLRPPLWVTDVFRNKMD